METTPYLERRILGGRWEDRNWRNVPGPFYAGATDEMALGRLDAPHRDFIAHIDDGLESYLRGYLFWLEQRREPQPGEALPVL
ncbi:hypothetical protein DEJ51_20650 [Streptomyces venezuelae]|uniref:Uncharacterized protein n=2 Tax=Streptomyces venezuelae TaxID=54571 RepID=A0A5P2DV95_STRVZ|nr:hypothetical protein DEJ51_20650 [Streptomyces venezuelae]